MSASISGSISNSVDHVADQVTDQHEQHPPPPSTAPRRLRSRSGCRVCRAKKVRCDELRPICRRCARLDLDCDYTSVVRKKYTRRERRTNESLDQPDQTAADRLLRRRKDNHADEQCTAPASEQYVASVSEQYVASVSEQYTASVSEQSPQQVPQEWDKISPTFDLPPECVRILWPCDSSAIDFFRFVLPSLVDNRDTMYSGPGMIWMLAQRHPMVLHMVCALGGRRWCEMNHRLANEVEEMKTKAIGHYGDGLRLLATAVQPDQDSIRFPDLKYVLATLWLMISYELKFGDGCCTGLETHLQGVTSILLQQSDSLHSLLKPRSNSLSDDDAQYYDLSAPDADFGRPCPISCQILVWIASADGAAVLNGFGGAFGRLLGDSEWNISEKNSQSRLESLRMLQQHAIPAKRILWGRTYPHMELLEDLRCTKLLCLEAEIGQLRFMVGVLVGVENRDGRVEASQIQAVMLAIRDVGSRYRELIQLADQLELPDGSPQGNFVIEVRSIVAFFHAVKICFLRVTHRNIPLTSEERLILKEIMSLTFKIYKDRGERALMRIAWQLFVVAIESDDAIYRLWITERFDRLTAYGENFRRASSVLHLTAQPLDGKKFSYLDIFRGDCPQRFLL
ncbi:hypothetical protein MBLNU13_g05206t1 [Cladosporium sp. NU13]